MATLEGVKRASRDWNANARDKAWAAHGGGRLEEADRLDARPDLAALLDATDRAYLATCREKEKKAKDAEEEQRRAGAELAQERADKLAERAQNSRKLATVTSAGLVRALALAGFAGIQWRNANLQRCQAERALNLATKTANSLIFDHPDRAEWQNDLSEFDGRLADLAKSASPAVDLLFQKGKQVKQKR